MDRDNRIFPRLPMSIEMEYRLPGAEDTGHRTGYSKNMSQGGLCMVLGRRLPPGSLVDLVLRLPDSYSAIRAVVRVVWAEEVTVGEDSSFDTGVAFAEVAPDDWKRLEKSFTPRW